MSTDEEAQLKAYLARMTFAEPRAPAPLPVALPFEPLPPIDASMRQAIERAALTANDRYLETFLEPHSFCPFARGGRLKGQTQRFVHYADAIDAEPLVELLVRANDDPSRAVVQVILPLVEVTPDDWIRFCRAVTAAGNARLRSARGARDEVFAVAPLHPSLPYSTVNPFALIPLFRRTPDPTIQWVRLDALDRLYAGRTGDTVFVHPDDLAQFAKQPQRTPLFDRIAETNQKMALRLGIPEVERTLRELSRAAQEDYARILLDDQPATTPRALDTLARAPQTDTTPPAPALYERDGRWALAPLATLPERSARRFLAAGVEVAVIRVGDDVHVLHGRCPHRHAPLSDAVVEDERLVCPHHGWDFSLATGRSQGVPGASVARFEATIEDGLVWIQRRDLDTFRSGHLEVFSSDDDIL